MTNLAEKRDSQIATLPQQMPQALAMIEKVLANPEINIEALDRMVSLQIRMMEHQAKMDFAAAMSRFNALKQPIRHNRTGQTAGSAKFSYADFPTLVTAISPWLTDCGLSFSHREDTPTIDEHGNIKLIMVYCTVKHVSGHSEEFHYPAVPDERLRGKVSPSQLIQLAITYAKRQTLAMALGLATADDKHDDDSQRPGKPISKKQTADLLALADEVGADLGKFLKFLKIDKLEDLPESRYGQAIKALEKKRSKA